MTRSRVSLIVTPVFVVFAAVPSVVDAGVFRDIGVGLGTPGSTSRAVGTFSAAGRISGSAVTWWARRWISARRI